MDGFNRARDVGLRRRFGVNIYEIGRFVSGACILVLTVIGSAWPHYRSSFCILMSNVIYYGMIFLAIEFIFGIFCLLVFFFRRKFFFGNFFHF